MYTLKQTIGLIPRLGNFISSGENYDFAAWQETNDRVRARLLQAESCPAQFALMSFPCGICSWTLESVITVVKTKNTASALCHSVYKVRRRHRGHAVIESVFRFPDNDVTLSESSSPSKLHYITGKIWELGDRVYNNTITAQAWQMTCHRPEQSQPADYPSNSRQHCKQATFENMGLK